MAKKKRGFSQQACDAYLDSKDPYEIAEQEELQREAEALEALEADLAYEDNYDDPWEDELEV